MKGVSFITDEHNRRTSVIIDLKILSKKQEAVEDFLDTILAESRKDDEDIPWDTAKKELKKAGKL